MTVRFEELPAWDAESGLLNVVVDTPRGSRNKYKYDDKTGLWRLSKVLPLGANFPHDFGFIPATRGGDGDPLDILVLTETPSLSRLRVDRPIDRSPQG
jgi:inorganic pyrophosphatase